LTTAKEIRAMLGILLTGKTDLDLDSFEHWLVDNTWNIRQNGGDPAALVLAAEIQRRLAEYSSGRLPLEKIMSEFRSLVESPVDQ
jgi:hypothetical protein